MGTGHQAAEGCQHSVHRGANLGTGQRMGNFARALTPGASHVIKHRQFYRKYKRTARKVHSTQTIPGQRSNDHEKYSFRTWEGPFISRPSKSPEDSTTI